MPHDVLISYSSKDKLQADAICNRLESRGIRCWIAPRDVPLGTEYAESIVEAIEKAKAMVLVFSANADSSHQVRREVERAVSKGVTIVPVRIEDAEMSKSIELYVSSMHWLDAITPPLEKHIDKLADGLSALISGQGDSSIPRPKAPPASPPVPTPTPAAAPTPAPAPAPAAAVPAGSSSRSGMKLALVGAALAVVLALAWLVTRSGGGGQASVEPLEEGAETSAGVGVPEEVGEPSDPASGDDALLTFVNETAVPLDVFWIDFEGQPEYYSTVEPGQEYTQETYLGHEWVIRLREDDGGTEVASCAAARAEDDCVLDFVTGWDVALAEFETPEGELQGVFRQSGPESWVEEDASGEVRFRFQEVARDTWSVYLSDASRAVEIQIDLWTEEIKYSDANNEQFVLTGIANASR